MNKVLQRLATFFIGIPLVVVIVALPYFNYLAIHIAVTIFALLGALELYEIFQKNSSLLPKALVIFFSFSLPLLSYIVFAFKLSPHIIELVFVLEILFLLSFNSITKKTFSDTNLATSLSSLIVLYVGYFSTFITRIYNFTNGVYFIALFLVMVFMCDSIAWLFGMTLGKTNRGILAVSPNKSIAGFIGGYTGSVLSAIIITKLFCDIYASS
ncbi:MAG: phosphatidate cytidylyltransferase [Treponema sp.]|nr:phosphatidate cytidylyltransferase [Treponema sp.]